MIPIIEPDVALGTLPVDCPPLTNPALARCVEAARVAFLASKERSSDRYAAQRASGLAYRQTMPPLTSRRNITDFISCVTYGLLIGTFADEAGKLLYAASIALHAFANEPKTSPKSCEQKEAPLPTPPVSPQTTQNN